MKNDYVAKKRSHMQRIGEPPSQNNLTATPRWREDAREAQQRRIERASRGTVGQDIEHAEEAPRVPRAGFRNPLPRRLIYVD